MELDEVAQLLDVSKEQYDEILSIVQRHTDETVSWLSVMAAEFSWVAQAASNSGTPENIFRITMVSRTNEGKDRASVVLISKIESHLVETIETDVETDNKQNTYCLKDAQKCVGISDGAFHYSLILLKPQKTYL